jgi:hypothetical protein
MPVGGHVTIQEVFHWALVIACVVEKREEAENHLHILQPARLSTEELAPSIVVVQGLEHANEFPMIQSHADFLGLEINAASIQTLEDHINTALIFGGFVLPDNCCMNDAIIQPSAILGIQVLVPLS